MTIRITCPGCKTSLTLEDEMRGKKVRCRKCEKALNIPAASNGKHKKDEEDTVQNGRTVKVRAKSAPAPAAADDEEEAPRPKKKKKKSGKAPPSSVLMLSIAAVAVVLIAGAGVTAFFMMRKEPEPQPAVPIVMAKAEEPKKERSGTRIVVPSREEGNPALKKGGVAVINNVRGSAWRLERKNELRNIGQYYVQFAEDYKGAERNMKNFKEYIKTAPSTIREPIEEGYYVMNFKADPQRAPSSIVAYERDEDNQGFKGHNVVKADTSVDYVSTADLKAALGN